jgi:hypothetical protein
MNRLLIHLDQWRPQLTGLAAEKQRSGLAFTATQSQSSDAANAARRVPREDRPLPGRGANLRARTGSVSGVTTVDVVDVEDVAGDE